MLYVSRPTAYEDFINFSRYWPFLVAQSKSTCSAGELGLIPGLGTSPGEGNGSPFQYSCPENPHGERKPGGYIPWGHKESGTTEQLKLTSYTQNSSHILLYSILILDSFIYKYFLTPYSQHLIRCWNIMVRKADQVSDLMEMTFKTKNKHNTVRTQG